MLWLRFQVVDLKDIGVLEQMKGKKMAKMNGWMGSRGVLKREDAVSMGSLVGIDHEQGGTVLSDGRYYTRVETAQILRCSERTLDNRVRNGDIKPLRNGRRVLFTKQCIEEFLKQNVPTPTPQTLH
jgi:excisionase family DNA binding protein